MLRILEGAYQKLTLSCEFVSLSNRMPMTAGGGDVKGVISSGQSMSP